MAFDSEEFLRRKELRQQRRQEKERKAKKQKLALIISAAVAGVLIVGFLIFALANRPAKNESQPSEQTGEQSVTTEAIPSNSTVIHLAAAGDLNVTDSVVASGGGNWDYTNTFLDVAALLADADITALNFEGAIYGADYTDRCAPPALAQALQKAGVDMVQLANSYSIYKGMDGLSSTVNGIKAAGMEPVGAYANAQEAKTGKGYTIRIVSGVKIAFVAFTKGMDGMALPAGSESCVNVLYTDYASTYQQVNKQGIQATMAAVKKEKPDLIVAMLHWGSEYNDTISTSQEQIRDILLESGADAIIGTHSHYVQKMEFDPDKGTFVAYSLGDFIGEASRSGSEYSVILDLEITKNKDTGDTKITGFTYTPIFTVNQDGTSKVLRIAQAMQASQAGYIDGVSQQTYAAMEYALQRIEARIKGE